MGLEHTDEYNKTLLINNQVSIENIFNLFKDKKKFMGVYFTDLDKPFITFKDIYTDFPDTFRLAKRNQCKGFIYSTSQDFHIQTSSFLI